MPATVLDGPDGVYSGFASAIASAGDVNGDGYGDIIVGALLAQNRTGVAHVFLGGAAGLSASPWVSLTGPISPNGTFGVSVASLRGEIENDMLPSRRATSSRPCQYAATVRGG